MVLNYGNKLGKMTMKKLVTLILFIWFGFASFSYAQSQDEKERREMIDKHVIWMHACFGDYAQFPPFNEFFESKEFLEFKKRGVSDEKYNEYINALEVDRSSGCVAAQSFMVGFFFSKSSAIEKKSSFFKESSTINDFVKFYETKTSVKLYLFEMNATFIGAVEGYNIGVGEFDENGISESTTFEQYRFLKEVNSNNYPMIESLQNSCVELYGDKSSIIKGYFWTCVHNDGINPPIPDLYLILNEF